MKLSDNGLALIKHYEGLRLNAYKCPAGVWTIGYGHTSGVQPDSVITAEQAEQYLLVDTTKMVTLILDELPVDLKQHQFDALVSFVYNVGIVNFRHSTLRKVVSANPDDVQGVKRELLRWVYANGKKMQGLVRRRQSEAYLYEFGKLNFDIK